jgi:hypothetical protein
MYHPNLSLIPAITNESTIGANDGSIDLTFTGDSVLSYEWSNGATTEDIFGLAGGEYSINIQTASGCAVGKTFYVATLDTTINNQSTDTTETTVGTETTENENETDTTASTGNPVPPIYNNNNVMSFIEKDITNENQTAGQIEIETFELTVYPNPATDNATVKWNGNAKAINVLNANGQVINNQEVGQMNQINLENLAQGVYHIQVIDFQNNIHTQKLIVQ